ncbi:MAG: enoyl-ACP reductase FabI [Bdellovibrionales bacterium]
MTEQTSTLPTGNLMQGKRGLIMGVANDRSIAWGIAKACANQGAKVGFTYQGEALEKRVRPLAESVNSDFIETCDVTDDASVAAVFDKIQKQWGGLDFVVHCIAFSDKNELDGKYVDTTRANFLRTMDISCFSFTAVCKHAVPLMKSGGSLLTLSYLGAVRVMPHYNVMGVAKAALEASVRYLAMDLGPDNIRVNAISAGPIKTLAAAGIGDFRAILKWNELNAPLRRNVSTEDVGKAGMYLLSDLGSGVSGEIHYVDGGYNAIGMLATDSVKENGELMMSLAGGA